jgi:hypothetical protein
MRILSTVFPTNWGDPLYTFFFIDGRSSSVHYYDKENYGWQTNPWFQRSVESEYNTYGVPELYRSATESLLTDIGNVLSDPPEDGGGLWASGIGSTPEWAYVHALLELAMMLETRMESVLINLFS